jgi:hypothetical protein
MQQTEIWVRTALEFYRRFGFFAAQNSLSVEELTAQIMGTRGALIESALNADESDLLLIGDESIDAWQRLSQKLSPDEILLSLDTTRIWWEDGECDVYPGGQIYEEVLPAWSAISRGAWQIENVKEQWQGNELESVNFDWEGDTYELCPQYLGWIDFELLEPINELIRECGQAFYSAPTGDQTTFLFVLSESERVAFENERGWKF